MASVADSLNPYKSGRLNDASPRRSNIAALVFAILAGVFCILWLRAENELWQYRTTFGPIENYGVSLDELPAK